MTYTDYITASIDTPSQSGLYATDLAGVSVKLLDDLTRDEDADWNDFFDYIYKTAQRNLKIDVHRKLADRFHIDKKLITRETGTYLNEYHTSGGVQIYFNLPKYARLQILSIDVFAENVSPVPQINLEVRKDDQNGEVLKTYTKTIVAGKNSIGIYQDFDSEDFSNYNQKLYVGFTGPSVKKTETRYYPNDTYLSEKDCYHINCDGVDGYVLQVNEGGLNVKFVIYCSLEKFIIENINLFREALFYRLGVDIMKERKTSQLVNLTTVLTEERAVELMEVFNTDYMAAVETATMNISMREDPICFNCKRSVSSKTNLP